MLTDFYATKTGMTQAWTADGKRLAVTRLKTPDNVVSAVLSPNILEVGYGQKKEKNVTKPLSTRFKKSGFSFMPAKLGGARWTTQEGEEQPKAGTTITAASVLSVGDVVEIRGITKGRGFAGAVKRYGFHGGPKTHGQSDRTRAVGSIGAGTSPGRVWRGKRMPGHYGVETKTIGGLVILHIDEAAKEIWVSGPVPGHLNSFVLVRKTGREQEIKLNNKASGITVPKVEETKTEVITEVEEATAEVAPNEVVETSATESVATETAGADSEVTEKPTT